ncbi:ParB/RepB/Spo0J family partition protein [Aeromonas veronii]
MDMTNFNSLRKMNESKVDGVNRGTNTYRVDLSLIHEEEEFNTREYDSPRVQAQINTYCQAYLAADAAYDADPKNSPNPGDACGDFEVRVENGVIYATEGHLRRRAALQAIQMGAKHITSVLVKEDKSKTKADSRARIQTSQDNLKLTPLEQARNYRNMRDLDKLTPAEIASKVNKETVHVIQTLQLLELPEEIIAYIRAGTIAAHPARELVRDYGAEQALALIKAGEEIVEEGKKVTPKIIEQAKQLLSNQPEVAVNEDDQNGVGGDTSKEKGAPAQAPAARTTPLQRKPVQRLSSKVVSELRTASLSLSQRLVQSASNIRLDSLADDDEVSLKVSMNKAELVQWMEFQQKLATDEGQGGEQGDGKKQLPLLRPEAWKDFDYPATHEEYADLQDRFEGMAQDIGLSPGEKDEAWEHLCKHGKEQDLKNLRHMRDAIKIALGETN